MSNWFKQIIGSSVLSKDSFESLSLNSFSSIEVSLGRWPKSCCIISGRGTVEGVSQYTLKTPLAKFSFKGLFGCFVKLFVDLGHGIVIIEENEYSKLYFDKFGRFVANSINELRKTFS